MKYVFTFFSLLIFYIHINAQSFAGKIINATDKTPIANASIYFNNTSMGTTSDNEGKFSFSSTPTGESLLIISSVGYETIQYTIKPSDIGKILIFEMNLKIAELEEVKVLSFEKDGWSKWGKLFLNNFIGTSAEAQNCKLLNHQVIKFSYNKREGRLIAIALEPLQILNKSLGYKIQYDLEGFEYNFNQRLLFFYGFQFFTELEARKGKQNRWHKKRVNVYTGSMLHFMRSLYANTLEQEGFTVNRMYKVPNYDKQRVQKIMRQRLQGNTNQAIIINGDGSFGSKSDSSEFYNTIMNQPNEFAYLINTPLTADSLVQKTDSGFVNLHFPNYLVISNKNKNFPHEYIANNFGQKYTTSNNILSYINMYTPTPVKVYANGNYIMPTNIISQFYWSWSEKIANQLPFDFQVK